MRFSAGAKARRGFWLVRRTACAVRPRLKSGASTWEMQTEIRNQTLSSSSKRLDREDRRSSRTDLAKRQSSSRKSLRRSSTIVAQGFSL